MLVRFSSHPGSSLAGRDVFCQSLANTNWTHHKRTSCSGVVFGMALSKEPKASCKPPEFELKFNKRVTKS